MLLAPLLPHVPRCCCCIFQHMAMKVLADIKIIKVVHLEDVGAQQRGAAEVGLLYQQKLCPSKEEGVLLACERPMEYKML